MPPLVSTESNKPLTIALEEIAEEKIEVTDQDTLDALAAEAEEDGFAPFPPGGA